MNTSFEPKNDLEQQLLDAQEGRIEGDDFMHALLTSKVFMPVQDSRTIGGFQANTRAKPLSLKDEDGTDILILFTSPDRARDFLKDFPGYDGGLLEEFGKLLAKMGSGFGIALNPGWDVGIGMTPDMVQHLSDMGVTAH
jgi:hypothetical protein